MILRDEKGRFVKGQPAHNRKLHIRKLCPFCGTEFFVKPSLDRIRYCSQSCAKKGKPSPWKDKRASPETRAKQRAAKLGIRGANHWNWRGGDRTQRKIAMGRDEYIQWRTSVFVRDDYTCQGCLGRGMLLEAHHIMRWATHPEYRYDLDNGITLCRDCHKEIPKNL